MSITLIAVVIALVLGHVAPALAASVRHYDWYAQWLRWLDSRFPQEGMWRGRYGIALALVPPLLAVALFQIALDAPLLGLGGLLFGIVVLFYCWGPRDLDLDVEAIMAAPDPAARRQAAAALFVEGETVALDPASLVAAIFANAKRRWFGVLLWFLLLGPFGAVLYRLAAVAAEGAGAATMPPDTLRGARWLLSLLDWPVAQLMTLSLALVGNFDTVIGAWKEHGGASFDLTGDYLAAAARASVRSELADEAMDYVDEGVAAPGALVQQLGELPELRDAMSLAWRILLLWLAVMALFVLAGWVA